MDLVTQILVIWRYLDGRIYGLSHLSCTILQTTVGHFDNGSRCAQQSRSLYTWICTTGAAKAIKHSEIILRARGLNEVYRLLNNFKEISGTTRKYVSCLLNLKQRAARWRVPRRISSSRDGATWRPTPIQVSHLQLASSDRVPDPQIKYMQSFVKTNENHVILTYVFPQLWAISSGLTSTGWSSIALQAWVMITLVALCQDYWLHVSKKDSKLHIHILVARTKQCNISVFPVCFDLSPKSANPNELNLLLLLSRQSSPVSK